MIRLFAALALFSCLPVAAQERTPSNCVAIADAAPGLSYVRLASYSDALPAETVRISFLDHATFLLQTHGGLSVVTDYTGYLGTSDFVPTVATMNNGHDTHWTSNPDPRIVHVLRGWPQDGKIADISLDLGEMLIRNVTTDLRGRPTDPEAQPRANGNSIFVFEVAGLCIGHLSHLHHIPTPAQFAALGRMDVVMAPADGAYTMDQKAMAEVITRLHSRLILPMHWFTPVTLESFLDGMRGRFPIEFSASNSIEVSRDSLPEQPTLLVLSPHWLD